MLADFDDLDRRTPLFKREGKQICPYETTCYHHAIWRLFVIAGRSYSILLKSKNIFTKFMQEIFPWTSIPE